MSAALLRAGLALAALGAPLFWTRLVLASYTTPKLAALAAAAFLCAAGWAAAEARGEPLARATPLDGPLAAASLAALAAVLFSEDPRLSLFGRPGDPTGGLWVAGLLAVLYYASAWSAAEPGGRLALARTLAASAGLAGAYGVLQRLGLPAFAATAELPHGRAVSTLGSPVDFGAFLAGLLPLCLALARSGAPALGWPAFAAAAAGLAASGSRAAWLGAAAGLAAASELGRAPARDRVPGRRALGLLAVGLAAAAAASWPGLRDTAVSDASRWRVWATAWAAFRESPWLGHGLDTFEAVFHRLRGLEFVAASGSPEVLQAQAHNDLLNALAVSGLAGLAAWLALQWGLLGAARAALRGPDRALAAGAAGGLTALWLVLKFDPVAMEVWGSGTLLAGLLAGAAAGPPMAPAPARRWAALLVLAVTAASLGAARSAWSGDRLARSANDLGKLGHPAEAAAAWKEASARSGCRFPYGVRALNNLGEAINASHDGDAKARYVADGEALGRRLTDCHPADAEARAVRAVIALMAVQLGLADRLPLAEERFESALRSDPWFESMLQGRLEVAKRRGDAPAAAAAQARLDRLKEAASRASK